LDGLGGIALLLYFGRPGVSEFGPWIIGAIIHSPYFVMGVIFGRAGMVAPSTGVGWLAFGLFLLVEAFAAELGKSPAVALAVGASATLLLGFALMALERWDRAARALEPLRAVGAASMAIYLAHVIFASGLRVGLTAAGVTDLWVHAMFGTLIGVLGPLALFLAARRSGATRLLGF
jgi:peptidoglycan/LPS O-acetylase OafA/YrhL